MVEFDTLTTDEIYKDLFDKQTRINDRNRVRWTEEIERKDAEIERLQEQIEQMDFNATARMGADLTRTAVNAAGVKTNSPEAKIAFYAELGTLREVNTTLSVLYGKLPMKDMDECFEAWKATYTETSENLTK